MSKAFVREDDAAEANAPLPVYPIVPPGSKNFLTAPGVVRLRQELEEIQQERRALSLGASDAEARQKIRLLDHRARHLQRSLASAEVVTLAPEEGTLDTVRFGATVRVRDQRGVETRYRLVGVDETNFERGEVSWLAPIAQALLNAKVGQRVSFKTPRGESALEILSISADGGLPAILPATRKRDQA